MKVSLLIFFFIVSTSLEAKTLKVMQYNLQNLFDTEHDEGTQDFSYLPLDVKYQYPGFEDSCKRLAKPSYVEECLNLDWNEAIVTKKIINLSRVIKAFDNSGKGPDIIIIQEVENKNVLNQLVTKGLSKMSYQSQVLIEGDDSRGIDVAVISKFPVISSQHHSLIIDGEVVDTRGILEVRLAVEDQEIVVFANHWPSQSNPTSQRIASAQLLNRVADDVRADLIIAAGDFNTLSKDYPSPFESMPSFIDAEVMARKVQNDLNPGTHFNSGKWNSLDRIFIHKNSALKPHYESFQIMNHLFMMKTAGHTRYLVPLRFDDVTGEGFSDHLPVGLNFNY